MIKKQLKWIFVLFGLIYLPAFSQNEKVYHYDFTINYIIRDTIPEASEIDTVKSSEEDDSTQTIEEPDSIQVDESDSVSADDESETVDSTEDKDWTYSAYLAGKSKSIKNGIPISKGKPLLELGNSLAFKDLTLSASIAREAFENIWSDYSIDLDYTYSLADWLDFSLSGSQFKYFNDTLNPNSSNSASMGGSFSFSVSDFSLDIGYERLFGGLPVNNISGSLSYFLLIDKFMFLAMADVTTSDYSKNAKDKIIRTKKLINNKSFIYTGIVAIKYKMTDYFSAGLTGGITEDYKGKITPLFKLQFGYKLNF